MAQSNTTLTCAADEDLADRVDEYQEKHGYASRNQALQDLIAAGLREEGSPILSRWRDEVINWAGLLGVLSVVLIVGATITPQLDFMWGLLMAITLSVMAVVLVGCVELARVISGSSSIGAALREVVGR